MNVFHAYVSLLYLIFTRGRHNACLIDNVIALAGINKVFYLIVLWRLLVAFIDAVFRHMHIMCFMNVMELLCIPTKRLYNYDSQISTNGTTSF